LSGNGNECKPLGMGDLRERLAAKPAICARPEGRSQRRVGELIHALRRRSIVTRAALLDVWRKVVTRTYFLPRHRHAL